MPRLCSSSIAVPWSVHWPHGRPRLHLSLGSLNMVPSSSNQRGLTVPFFTNVITYCEAIYDALLWPHTSQWDFTAERPCPSREPGSELQVAETANEQESPCGRQDPLGAIIKIIPGSDFRLFICKRSILPHSHLVFSFYKRLQEPWPPPAAHDPACLVLSRQRLHHAGPVDQAHPASTIPFPLTQPPCG